MPAANTAVDAASGEQTSPSRGVNPKALFVTGLSLDAEFVDLHKHFDRFGTIVLCRVLKDAKTGISRGIGYVNFDSEEEAAAAQKATDGFPGPRDESALSVKFAEADPTYRAVATTKVFVRYVPVDFTTAQVAEVFSKYGKVTEVVIDADRSRAVKKGPTPWNYAYVQFTTTGEANKAIANGAREVQWSSRPITVKPAEGEETRQLRCGKSNASVAVSSASSTTSSATLPAQLATASTTRSNTPVKDVDSCTPSKPEPAFLTLAQSTSIDEAFATALPTPVPSVPAKGVTAVATQPEFVFQSQRDVNSGGFVTAMPTYYAAPQGMPFILAPGTAGGYFAAAPQPLQYVQFGPHPFAPHGAPTAPTVACGAPTWMSYAPVQQQSSFGVAPWASHDGMMMPSFAAPSY